MMPREKNIDKRRKILQLYNQGIRSPKKIAESLGEPPSRVRKMLYVMRKEGLLPKINPIGDLLDETSDLIKASLFRVSAIHAEMIARNDKLAKPLAEAQEMLQRALEDIAIYRKMKQLEVERR